MNRSAYRAKQLGGDPPGPMPVCFPPDALTLIIPGVVALLAADAIGVETGGQMQPIMRYAIFLGVSYAVAMMVGPSSGKSATTFTETGGQAEALRKRYLNEYTYDGLWDLSLYYSASDKDLIRDMSVF